MSKKKKKTKAKEVKFKAPSKFSPFNGFIEHKTTYGKCGSHSYSK